MAKMSEVLGEGTLVAPNLAHVRKIVYFLTKAKTMRTQPGSAVGIECAENDIQVIVNVIVASPFQDW